MGHPALKTAIVDVYTGSTLAVVLRTFVHVGASGGDVL
jgi:hypothetical protein